MHAVDADTHMHNALDDTARRPASWHSLGVGPDALRLAPTLLSGMSFRWRRREQDDEVYVGVLGRTVLEVREDEHASYFRVILGDTSVEQALGMLRAHLSLERGVPTSHFLRHAHAPSQFVRAAAALPGVRVLNIGSHLEALVTFVGSANNNIKRNMKMVESLCAAFPENRLGVDALGDAHHAFPSLAQLATLSEADLWELGWGYRAPRVHKLVAQLQARGGEQWLAALPAAEDEARALLCELCGVGRKVADCVLLFSYGFDGCVPVDTHCFQMAERFMLPAARGKSLTPAVYAQIVEAFHKRFGADHAGWAFSAPQRTPDRPCMPSRSSACWKQLVVWPRAPPCTHAQRDATGGGLTMG